MRPGAHLCPHHSLELHILPGLCVMDPWCLFQRRTTPPPATGIYICDLPMPGCAQRRWDMWGRGYRSPCPRGPPRRLQASLVPSTQLPSFVRWFKNRTILPTKHRLTYFLKIICLGDPLSRLGILLTKCGLNPITSPPPTNKREAILLSNVPSLGRSLQPSNLIETPYRDDSWRACHNTLAIIHFLM